MSQASRLIAVLVLAASAVGCAARTEDTNRRILHGHNLMVHAGYGGLGPVSGGDLAEGESTVLRTALAAGRCYVLAVFGAGGIEDVNLSIVAPGGAPVTADRTAGPTAVVDFCAEREGEHEVTVASALGSGSFRMAYWFRNGEGGGPEEETGGTGLTLGRPVTGLLPPGQPFVDYTLRLTEPRMVTIDLMSDEFDCYLYLLQDGAEIARDDDGGAGLNSRIMRPLTPGTYTVRVGSFMNSGAGNFTLSAR